LALKKELDLGLDKILVKRLLMKHILICILIFFLYSCNNKKKNEENNISNSRNENINKIPFNRVYPNGKYHPEYPLARFYYDENISNLNKSEKIFPKEINDLVIDTTNQHLIISFDYEGELSCILNGQIDRKWNNGKENDTVYLDYFKNCDGIEKLKKAPTKIRLYYQFTDELSYNKKIFIPRRK
jgi:hypothetical protein